MQPILIKNGRIIDPSQDLDQVGDILIENGRIKGINAQIDTSDDLKVIDASGLTVTPGFIDVHCHLREPGFEYKETIASGTKAAAKGGFTTICAMPNTNPVMDNRSTVDYVLNKAKLEGTVRVLPIGAVTKGSNGVELSEMGELAEAGCIGFSDDGQPVADSHVMRQALSYANGLGLPIINHCETPELFRNGTMNEGWVSNRLGLQGAPNAAEETMVARDIALAEMVGGKIHLAHISTAGTLELVRNAKEKGIQVTCEVTPHHLTLTDEAVMGLINSSQSRFDPLSSKAYDTHAKVNPPLRTKSDMDAMAIGLNDGIIDIIATDHAPHAETDKLCTFEEAAMGISVLETAFGSLMSLVNRGTVALPLIIGKLTSSPAKFLNRDDIGTLKNGSRADVTIISQNTQWIVESGGFVSKGKNSPLNGSILDGQIITTLVGGKVVFDAQFNPMTKN